jgi:hypothetical protein
MRRRVGPRLPRASFRHVRESASRWLQPRTLLDRSGYEEPARVILLHKRYDNWKVVFMEQRANGQMLIWANPFTNLRVPKIFNLRTDPYERADITSNTYYDWLFDHVFLLVPAQDYVGQFLATFRDYPQRQKAASFNLDEVMAKLRESKQ